MASTVTPAEKLSELLRNWLAIHESAGSLVLSIMNLKNKAKDTQLKSLDELLSASPVSNAELFVNKIITLREAIVDLKSMAGSITEAINDFDNRFRDCDAVTSIPFLQRLERQTLLDIHTAQVVVTGGDLWTEWSQHDMYTVISCFNYSPYVNMDEVKMLAEACER